MNNIELCINLLERIKDDSWKIQEKERLYRESLKLDWKDRTLMLAEMEKYADVSKENYKRTLMLVRKLLKEEYE